jgi:hypothetical protein
MSKFTADEIAFILDKYPKLLEMYDELRNNYMRLRHGESFEDNNSYSITEFYVANRRKYSGKSNKTIFEESVKVLDSYNKRRAS